MLQLVDSVFCNALRLITLAPRPIRTTAIEVMLSSTDVLTRVAPEVSSRVAWQELHNKLQAFYLFQHADSVLGLGTTVSLEQMIGKTRTLGPFFSVWAMEGVGYHHADILTSKCILPNVLLSGYQNNLPTESLVPLHAGMGLALAEAQLARGCEMAILAENFVELCRSNSRPDYWLAAVEALGLVIRNLYPGSLKPLDDYFSQTNEELLACFWHGVGRGLYFSLNNSLPYWNMPWQGFDLCLQEPAHELGRCNAVSGFVWAMTLINLRHPEIIAAFLKRKGGHIAAHDAVANGVFSALCVWLHSAPTDSSVRLLCEYQPDLEPFVQQLWETHILQSASNALQYSNLNNVGELFRYRP